MKTAIITGGSGGIGSAIVRKFSENGWRCAFSYNKSKEKAQTLSKETGAIAIKADFLHDEDTSSFLNATIEQLCHVDAFIVNAGNTWQGMLCDMPRSAWDDIIKLHLTAPFEMLKEIIPLMRNRGGSVVFISSIWGKHGASCEAAYSAAKAGQIALMRSLAKEEGSSGIRFNAVCPGPVDTSMLDVFSLHEKEDIVNRCVLKHMPDTLDIAEITYFLCTDSAKSITGQAISVDSGFI
ncbi:MAG TPA: SDR family oxidoreductase [Christensenellaceae bacterium]|jgi:3-oxoacyl-[acyl-carrier protein] reductase|nr:SDR family oxidoreductase [Christensenellaceae bacterium]